MSLDDIIEKVGCYSKAFIKVFLDHEYSYLKFVDKEDLYSNKTSVSRDNALHNTYKNNLNKEEDYSNE